MIYELRTYTLKVGRTADYLSVFGEKGYPLICRYAEPVGFWQTGPVGTGVVDQVHHIWAYESVQARLTQRGRLYADPAWTGEVMPAVFSTLEQLHGRLMTLDPETEPALAAAQDGERRGAVLAHWTQSGRGTGAGLFATFRALTGQVGRTLTLQHLCEADATETPPGGDLEIWLPAGFSRIR
jgi:hypothetical protein